MELNDVEQRVLGCLLEKAVISPDHYPMTLNALTAACNQKSSRDPVMTLSEAEVRSAANALAARHLVRVDENFRRGTHKYGQRLCNTTYSGLQLDEPQYAVLCLLLLRGAQTPGELKARSGRLHEFVTGEEVLEALEALASHEAGALVVRLTREPGRRDAAWAHTLGAGHRQPRPARVQTEVHPEPADAAGPSAATLSERVERLEREVAELRRRLDG